jgi:hypothetical protein
MYATAMTRAPFGKRQQDGTPRALLARESSWRGWGWHVLALHHRPHGWVEQDLGGFLHSLYRDLFLKGALHLVDKGATSQILLVFPNNEALVARCDRPAHTITQLLDRQNRTLSSEQACRDIPGALVFAPFVLRISNTVELGRALGRLRTIARVQADGATMARVEQDMDDALAILDRLGPVQRPWDARPGDTVAPWAMGRANNPFLEHAVKGALRSLVPSLPDTVAVKIIGRTVDDAGVPRGTPFASIDSVVPNPADFAEWDRFLAWVAKLHTQDPALLPPAHCIAQEAEGYAKPGRDSKRVGAPILRTTARTTSAHHALECFNAYNATLCCV